MKNKNNTYVFVFIIVIIFLISGCVGLGGYGKIRLEQSYGMKTTIQDLQKNWGDYTVFYAGLDIDKPGAIMFDPKNDEKKLVGHEWWAPVKDQEQLTEILHWANTYYSYYSPVLWRILGPDNQFYGYLYTGYTHVMIRKVDDSTLWVDELVVPPDVPDESDGDDQSRETFLRLKR